MLPAAILLSPCLFSGAIVTHTTSVHTTIVQVSFAKVASRLRDAGSTNVSTAVREEMRFQIYPAVCTES